MRKVTALMLGLLLVLAMVMPAAAAGAGGAPAAGYGIVADALGRPIAGAEVEVYRLDQGLVGLLRTDGSGAFRLEEPVQSGSLWQLRVWAKGYRTAATGWVDLARNRYQTVTLEPLIGQLLVTVRDEAGLPVAGQVMVTDASGRIFHDGWVDSGRLSLDLLDGNYTVSAHGVSRAPAVRSVAVSAGKASPVLLIARDATVAVSGEVRDGRTGKSLAGATVELLKPDYSVMFDAGRADDHGRFRMGLVIGGSAPQSYLVRVAAPGYRDVTTQAFTLAAGQEKDLSGKEAVVLAPAMGVISGTVLKHDGNLAEGFKVALDAMGYGEVAQATTTKDGSFRFANVDTDPAIQYRVRIVTIEETGTSAWMAYTPGITDQLVLQSGTPGRGSYVLGQGSISGAVVTPAGAPVEGARVELYRQNILQKTMETDAEGAFKVDVVQASGGTSPWMVSEPYTIRISKNGFVSSTEVTVAGEDVTSFHVAANARTAMRAVLRSVKAQLRGRVVSTSGKPVAAAEVYLMSGLTPVGGMVRTDADGWYSMSDVPLGPANHYFLRAKGKGQQPISGVPVMLTADTDQTLPTLKMSPAATVFTGQVLDANGRPQSGATVTARGADGGLMGDAQSDAAGVYRIEAGQRQGGGPVSLVAEQYGFTRVAAEVADANPGAPVVQDLVITSSTGRLSGQVLDKEGMARAGARVALLEEGRGVIDTATTDQDGRYRFESVSLDGSGWFSLRIDRSSGISAGSVRHGTDMVPQIRLIPGEEMVLDLLVR